MKNTLIALTILMACTAQAGDGIKWKKAIIIPSTSITNTSPHLTAERLATEAHRRQENDALERIDKVVERIVPIRQWKVQSQAKPPRQTISDNSGSCWDFAVLTMALAEKEGLKSNFKLYKKHVTCIIIDKQGRKWEYDNGRRIQKL